MTSISRLAVLALSMLLMAACASTPSSLHYQNQVEKVWPSAPDQPRFVYAGELTGVSNFKASEGQGWARKAYQLLTGLLFGDDRKSFLKRPSSGLVDSSSGRIYVTDVGRKGVFVFDQAIGELLFWDAASTRSAFQTPIAITKGPADELWVTDADLAIVVRLNQDGEPLGYVGEGQLQRPTGIVADPGSQRVFVADSAAHDIKVFAADGKLLQTIGHRGEGPGEFNGPTHLSIDRDHLYVTDTLNSRLQLFSLQGKFVSTFGERGVYKGNMPRPKGVAVDGAGHIYVVESYYDYLLVYDAEGRLLLPLGGTGQGAGEFYLPAGVWTDGDRRIYVADMFNGRVVSFDYVGDNGQTAASPDNNHNTGG